MNSQLADPTWQSSRKNDVDKYYLGVWHGCVRKCAYMHVCVDVSVLSVDRGTCTHQLFVVSHMGVATVSRIDKIIGLFCRIASLL